MGNNQESYSNKFHRKYNFIQLLQDQNYGTIKVYRKQQLNFDYVMILEKYMEEQQLIQLEKQISYICQSFYKDQQPMLLKIFNYQTYQRNFTQCNIPMIKLYIQYLNFTLANLTQKHEQQGQTYTFQQILYILNSTMKTYQFCLDININLFSCSINSIFLTPEGFIKFSPIKVKDFIQDPNAFCNALCNPTIKNTMQYDKNHKHFISQFKRLLTDLLRINKNISSYQINSKQNFLLKKLQIDINSSRTLQQLKKCLPKTNIDCLIVKNKSVNTDSLPTSQRPNTRDLQMKIYGKKSMKYRGYYYKD